MHGRLTVPPIHATTRALDLFLLLAALPLSHTYYGSVRPAALPRACAPDTLPGMSAGMARAPFVAMVGLTFAAGFYCLTTEKQVR